MLKAGNITKGMFILFRKEPYQVLEKEFFNLGRGRGHLRAKLKNIKNGNITRYTFKSEDPIEKIELESKKLQYLYKDENEIYFMDTETFKQTSLPVKIIGKLINFLKEGDEYQVILFSQKAIGVRPPAKVTLKVIQAEEGVKGDSVSGANKTVVLQTGYSLKTPLFIKKGDKIIVNTQKGEYVSRA